MKKELIERLALEVGAQVWPDTVRNTGDLNEFATRFLSAYLAERGKEAVAVVDDCDDCKWADILPNVDVRAGDLLFLAPQIPEGMVPRNPEPYLICGDIAVSSDPRYAGWVFVEGYAMSQDKPVAAQEPICECNLTQLLKAKITEQAAEIHKLEMEDALTKDALEHYQQLSVEQAAEIAQLSDHVEDAKEIIQKMMKVEKQQAGRIKTLEAFVQKLEYANTEAGNDAIALRRKLVAAESKIAKADAVITKCEQTLLFLHHKSGVVQSEPCCEETITCIEQYQKGE